MPTSFGCTIIGTATRFWRGWHDRNCPPETANKGECVDDLHRDFFWLWRSAHGSDAGLREAEPWCAELVSLVLHEAAKERGIAPDKTHNVVPVSRQAIGFLNHAKQYGLRVDSKPAPGCVFWRPRSGGTGHVGIVVAVSKTNILTVEGNASGTIQRKLYDRSQIASYRFLHVEERFGTTPAPFCLPNIYNWWEWAMLGVGVSSASTIGYVYWKKRRKQLPAKKF